ncbi:MAG: ABC transporter ATP-binding protein [candidate division NC10 bacterium]
MIEVSHLVKTFGRRNPSLAVDDASFSVKGGTVFGLLGPPRAGKTTTLRILSTTLRPTSGTVEIGGMDILADTRKVRELMGFAPDLTGFAGWTTGKAYLEFWGKVSGLPKVDRRKRIRDAVEFLELEENVAESPDTYPVGVAKRLVLAQALLANPQVGLFDEPTRGLSTSEKVSLLEKLRTLRKEGMTIVLTSQALSDVQSLCDRIVVMSEGQTTEVQDMSTLLRKIGQGRHSRIFLEADDITSEATSALEALDGVIEIRTTPTTTIIYVEPGKVSVEAIRQTIEGQGIEVRGLKEAGITLGDVFRAVDSRGES